MILSFTGADNKTDIDRLVRINAQQTGIFLSFDFGVLLYPEKQGHDKNPGYLKRLEIRKQLNSTVHLCGRKVFEDILSYKRHSQTSALMNELTDYSVIQVNINARKREFSREQVFGIYDKLLDNADNAIIVLQYHDETKEDILEYLRQVEKCYSSPLIKSIQILLDESRGKGIVRQDWTVSDESIKQYPIRIAGGINPGNVADVIKKYYQANGVLPAYVDMESGIRSPVSPGDFEDGTFFDINKVEKVIHCVKDLFENGKIK